MEFPCNFGGVTTKVVNNNISFAEWKNDEPLAIIIETNLKGLSQYRSVYDIGPVWVIFFDKIFPIALRKYSLKTNGISSTVIYRILENWNKPEGENRDDEVFRFT